MSGTSLDGLDIAFCEFSETQEGKWQFAIVKAETIEYEASQKASLADLMTSSGIQLTQADFEFGRFIGNEVKAFCNRYNLTPDFVASHGHTIFHQPASGFTLQIGSGAGIYAACGFPVIADFRSVDVALGGQGAPLVPIGDKLLFSDYEFCLNLGGIANISYDDPSGARIAYDICPVNIVMNYYAKKLGQEYDKDGILAGKGKVNQELLAQINRLPFYSQPGPKSLGKEWIDEVVFPLLAQSQESEENILATFSQHIAEKIAETVNTALNKKPLSKSKLLATGGGAFNKHLIENLQKELPSVEVVVAPSEIVMFKEALIFAFLGVLRMKNKANCLKSVTGASTDNIGGCLYGPLPKFN